MCVHGGLASLPHPLTMSREKASSELQSREETAFLLREEMPIERRAGGGAIDAVTDHESSESLGIHRDLLHGEELLA